MKIAIRPEGTWYHGSNHLFDTLREGSTITQWRQLAEAFAHKPTQLSYEEDGSIQHNGTQPGYLYAIDEPVKPGKDVCQHPRSTMDENAEFLTMRPLKLRLLARLDSLESAKEQAP